MPKNLKGPALTNQKEDCINRTRSFNIKKSISTQGKIHSCSRLNNKNSTFNQLVIFLEIIGYTQKLNIVPIDLISEFIQTKAEDGNSNETLLEHISIISSTFTALRNLKYAVAISDQDFADLRTEFRTVGIKAVHKNRAFKSSKKVVEDLYEFNNTAGIVSEFQETCGYRIHEVLQINPGMIEVLDDGFYIKEGMIKGKGGFPLHQKKISSSLVKKITVHFASVDSWKITAAQYNSDIKQVTGTKYSSHSFRYNYAQALYAKLTAEGYTVPEAKRIVAEAMGHHRKDITDHYLV